MNEDIKERLKKDLGSANWSDLLPQLAHDQLIVVSKSLDILDIGLEIANDNADLIGQWLGEGKISKPTTEEIERWTKENPKFLCAIVQPFVLIKEAV